MGAGGHMDLGRLVTVRVARVGKDGHVELGLSWPRYGMVESRSVTLATGEELVLHGTYSFKKPSGLGVDVLPPSVPEPRLTLDDGDATLWFQSDDGIAALRVAESLRRQGRYAAVVADDPVASKRWAVFTRRPGGV